MFPPTDIGYFFFWVNDIFKLYILSGKKILNKIKTLNQNVQIIFAVLKLPEMGWKKKTREFYLKLYHSICVGFFFFYSLLKIKL